MFKIYCRINGGEILVQSCSGVLCEVITDDVIYIHMEAFP